MFVFIFKTGRATYIEGNPIEIVLQAPEEENTLGRKSRQQCRRLLRDQAVNRLKTEAH